MEENIQEPRATDKENSFLLPGSIIAAGLIIALSFAYVNSDRKKNPDQQSAAVKESQTLQPPQKTVISEATVLGNPSAPLTIIEFGDFQCFYCQKFFRLTEPQLIEKYVKTGKAKFIYKHLAFLGQESIWAAQASECAQDQNKFWEMHDVIYQGLEGENTGSLNKDALKKLATEIGLKTEEFNSCLDSNKHLDRIQRDNQDAQNLGINSTPTVFINDKRIDGFVPFEDYELQGRMEKGLQFTIEEEFKKIK